MTTSRDPDEILSAWLDEGPTRLPDQTRRVIAVALPTTTQRRHAWRLPWRFTIMSTTPKLAIGAAAVIAVFLGGAFILGPRAPDSGVGGAPTASPAASPSPSPSASASAAIDTTTWTPYTSPRYGYQASYPSGWSYGPSSTFWTVPEPEGALMPMIDIVYGGYVGPDDTWAATSMKVPADMSNTAWTDLYRQGQIDPSMPIACFPPPEE